VSDPGSFGLPDPFVYRSVWGIPPSSREGFDLLVARQMIWMPYAAPQVRRMLFTESEEPICPACDQIVTQGTPSVICAAVLADRALQEALARDPTVIATKDPDAREAWWLMHGTCRDELTADRRRELDLRLELALRAETRTN
jgi:hypothetical protein